MTQEQRLLSWLSDGSWHCASEALDGRLYTFSQRASDVNAKERRANRPDRIIRRPCTQHEHPMYQYADSFRRSPQQLALVAS